MLKKRIPHGAGLGGGSSDAASTLLALNELFETNLPREALAKMAQMIGSDVPFFIFGSAAVCKGRGELVSPTRLRKPLSLLLLKPEFGVPTPWAYSRWRDSREIRGVSYGAQQFTRQSFVNDLERPVFEKFVFLAQLKMWLLKQPEVDAALMSGSGSTVFAGTAVEREYRSSGETRKSRARSGTLDLSVRDAVANSGERTRLACWRARPAIANFPSRSLVRSVARLKNKNVSA